jgi:signal transduction histidine kinase
MRRLPIRLRLTAAFAVVMTLVLAGVWVATSAHFGAALDEAIDANLAAHTRDLTTVPLQSTGPLVNEPDLVEQILTPDGRVRAASPRVAATPLLTPTETATAVRDQLRIDRATLTGLTGRARVLATPTSDGTLILVVAASLAGRDRALADLRAELAVALPLVLFIATAGAYLLAAAALRPVDRMRARAAAITEDTPESRLPVPPGRDEITRLGGTLNDLLDRLHAALTRERDFVADASHELRTPLAMLKTELELAVHRPRSPDETDAALQAALGDTRRLVALAEDLLLLARTDRGQHPTPQPTPLAPLLHRVAERHRATAGGRPIRVHCPADLVAVIDAGQLERAVANLVDNAWRHGAGPVDVTAAIPDGHLVVQVRDHGCGFPPDFLPRAFDRFTRPDTARTGPGTGLGLAIVAAIARRHTGTAHAANHPDGGAEITLRLPAPHPPAPGST